MYKLNESARDPGLRDPAAHTCTSQCCSCISIRRDRWLLTEGNPGRCSGADRCVLLTSLSIIQRLHWLRVTLPRPRHEAFNMAPTVHGSWPKEFLFYESTRMEKKNHFSVQHSGLDKIPKLVRTQLKPDAHWVMPD